MFFLLSLVFFFFFFNDTATTEIYTLSLHDALPIWRGWGASGWTEKYCAMLEDAYLWKSGKVLPDRGEVRREGRRPAQVHRALQGTVEVRSPGGQETVVAGHRGEAADAVFVMGPGNHLDGLSAQLLESFEQRRQAFARETASGRVGHHGHASCPVDPVQRILQVSPSVLHEAGPSADQIMLEHRLHVGHDATLYQIAGEVGAAHQVGIGRQPPGTLKRPTDAHPLQLLGHAHRPAVAPCAHLDQAGFQTGIVGVDGQPDDVHRLLAPGDRNLHPVDQPQAGVGRRLPGFGKAAQFVVVGEGQHVYPVFGGPADHLPGAEETIGNGGVAVQIDVHGEDSESGGDIPSDNRKVSMIRATTSGWSWCRLWPASATTSRRK